MTVKEIVKKYLEDNGYSGLYEESGECGCELLDLAPCGDMMERCHAGYKVKCTEECSNWHEFIEEGWHIQKERP